MFCAGLSIALPGSTRGGVRSNPRGINIVHLMRSRNLFDRRRAYISGPIARAPSRPLARSVGLLDQLPHGYPVVQDELANLSRRELRQMPHLPPLTERARQHADRREVGAQNGAREA